MNVGVGARVFVVGDLSLGAAGEGSGRHADLVEALDSWEGPGVLVVAGGLFDVADLGEASLAEVLRRHPAVAASLKRFALDPQHQIAWLPNTAELDRRDVVELRDEISAVLPGIVVMASLDLEIVSGEGVQRVRVEPGDRWAGTEPVVAERTRRDFPAWLFGAEQIDDVRLLPRFLVSRFVYRWVLRWWFLLALITLVAVVKLPLSLAAGPSLDRYLGPRSDRLEMLAVVTAADLAVVLALAAFVLTRGWRHLVGAPDELDENHLVREAGRELIASGFVGYVAGSAAKAELRGIGTGFFAAPGTFSPVVVEHRGLAGLPPAYTQNAVSSWIELDAGIELHARLVYRAGRASDATVFERFTGRRSELPRTPTVVASFPVGDAWPTRRSLMERSAAIRRRAGFAILLAGAFDVVDTLTPPFEARLRWLLQWVPLAVPQAASAAVAVAGVGLLVLARGIRRGGRDAYRITVALLAVTAVLNLVKGGDVEEALVAALVAAYLVRHRAHFGGRPDRVELRRRLLGAALVLPLTVVTATVSIEVITAMRGRRVALGQAFLASAERVVGVRDVVLTRRLDDFLSPVLATVGIGVALWVAWMVIRPVTAQHRTRTDEQRAQALVQRWGSGTLDYFALRSDKHFFFSRDTVVAYAIHAGVCLVSPDPIGPPWERDAVWDEFCRFVDGQGWVVAVLAAGEDWLPTYRQSAMHDLYVGDEAVVDLTTFSLDGRRNKGIRQAYTRIANHGYTITFHDPAHIDDEMVAALQALSGGGRRGEAERGFSMTLGRMFDPSDKGLLLAVASDAGGQPVAFCQFVPAPGVDGYSLDVMRRDCGEHPNGLLEFVLVSTILHLREQGKKKVSLNFATMRAVLAGETEETMVTQVERWALRQLSSSMQIESLWHFNAKFHPHWQPRYVVYDSPDNVLSVAVAIARAESFWELPLVGRFMTPQPTPTDA